MVSNSLDNACQEIFPQINPQNKSWGTCEGEPCQTLIDAWQTLAIDLQLLYMCDSGFHNDNDHFAVAYLSLKPFTFYDVDDA